MDEVPKSAATSHCDSVFCLAPMEAQDLRTMQVMNEPSPTRMWTVAADRTLTHRIGASTVKIQGHSQTENLVNPLLLGKMHRGFLSHAVAAFEIWDWCMLWCSCSFFFLFFFFVPNFRVWSKLMTLRLHYTLETQYINIARSRLPFGQSIGIFFGRLWS